MSDIEEAKRKRAERFGIPVVETKPDPPPKQGKPGKGKGGGGDAASSEEDKARIAAREARFGKLEGSGKRKVEEAKQAEPIDPEEEERRKKRAARFGGLPA